MELYILPSHVNLFIMIVFVFEITYSTMDKA